MSQPWDVVLATTDPLPEPDPCEAPLLAALRRLGLRATSWPWRDPSLDWGQTRALILRATWDYPWHLEAFKNWLTRVDGVTKLLNPMTSLRWNLHKRYLLDLGEAGVPCVPTHVAPKGCEQSLEEIVVTRGWDDVVVKPAEGAGSFETYVMPALSRDEARFKALVAQRDLLVQPYIATVESVAERAMVFIAGEFSHAMHKEPRFTGQEEKVSGPHPVTDAELKVAKAALAAVPGATSYARVDLFRGEDGSPMVSEVELLEPSLFLWAHPPAADALAAHLQAHLAA